MSDRDICPKCRMMFCYHDGRACPTILAKQEAELSIFRNKLKNVKYILNNIHSADFTHQPLCPARFNDATCTCGVLRIQSQIDQAIKEIGNVNEN